MSAFDALNLLSFVKRRIQSGASHKAIVEELRNYYPGVRGINIRSLKRFCVAHNLHATARCSDGVLDILVAYVAGTVS